MNRANPTPLRIGASGTLHGWSVRVVGRVVLGVEIEGETYYWNEYNVIDRDGVGGTIVYEEGDNGPEWKLFTEFEPATSLTAAAAAAKRAGDTVDIDGEPAQVTLVDESRVYHIEGTAPEGVEVGDVAHYFNAQAGERMLVVSWTGDQVEFYEGRNLRGEDVAAAFGFTLPPHGATAGLVTGGATTQPAGKRTAIIVALAMLVVSTGFAVYSCGRSRSTTSARRDPAAKTPAPVVRLASGARGTLQHTVFTIVSGTVTEIDRVGARHDDCEYQLAGEAGETALLVNGLTGSAGEWLLFVPTPPPAALAELPPYAAAALRKGAAIPLGDRTAQVTELFLARPPGAAPTDANVRYGFLARTGPEWLMARWNETTLAFYRGRGVPDADVRAAFASGAAANAR